jgi:hypothetical protein
MLALIFWLFVDKKNPHYIDMIKSFLKVICLNKKKSFLYLNMFLVINIINYSTKFYYNLKFNIFNFHPGTSPMNVSINGCIVAS